MRHRITSFRCVEANANMSPLGPQRKTCIAIQIRQSSTVRAASGHAGITSGTAPGIDTAIRPRLKAIPSSKLSNAGSSAVTRIALGSKRAGRLRAAELVHRKMLGAGVALVRAIVTLRVALVHSTTSRAVLVESMNRAALPAGVAWYVHDPGATRTVL